VSLCLVDVSPAMLAVARGHLADRGIDAEVRTADLVEGLPEGPFDAVVSALAIHHLVDDEKRRLFGRVAEVLVPGGVFVNAEQVAGPTPELDAAYHRRWLAETAALGASHHDHEGAGLRMAHDLPAPVLEQCQWLEAAGFAQVDLCYKRHRFAVFAAWTLDDRAGADGIHPW
jgi:tRNA (cmo5U34)-methyltransferase